MKLDIPLESELLDECRRIAEWEGRPHSDLELQPLATRQHVRLLWRLLQEARSKPNA